MQTFLPYRGFEKSARCLDNRRLGKQRVETLQILNLLLGATTSKGWQKHPAVRMWCGYELSLIEYGLVICETWMKKGYQDTCYGKISAHSKNLFQVPVIPPPWLGKKKFHSSHRANLLRKDQKFYSQFGWTEDPTMPYWWPV